MAFWGVEVKPEKPFTHKYDDSKGRLHVSMATLGLGSSANAKSTLQCNVGNRSPVYLCSLYPRKTESLQLNLELEEHDQVIFSVIGPTSIHLCGYYLSTPPNANAIHPLDDSESYGEDIANTETDRSDYSDDDDYDDSFIDDDADPEVFSSSPISAEEEASHDNIPKVKKGSSQRLRKKYQSVESDDDGCDEEKIIVDGHMDDQTEEIENVDSLPISSLYKKKDSGRVLDQEMNASVDRGAGDASNNNGTDGGNSTVETNLKADPVLVDSQTHRDAELSNHSEDPCTVVDVGDAKNLKKKKNRKDKETKSSCNDHSIKLDNGIGSEPKMEKMNQDFVEGNNQQQHAEDKEAKLSNHLQDPCTAVDAKNLKKKKNRKDKETKSSCNGHSIKLDNGIGGEPKMEKMEGNNQQQHAEDKETETTDKILPSSQVDHTQGEKPKKKRKERSKEAALLVPTDASHNNLDLSQSHEYSKQHAVYESVYNGAHEFPGGNQSEDRKVKKRKKSKNQGNGEVANSDMPVSVEQNAEPEMTEDRNKREDTKPSQVKTLSNGLVIEELEKGKKNGKIAASGKKISIYYTGKLKENGVVFESNAGQAPLKFRLGKGKVMEGWNVGLEGMQVGEKRRLVIPPSLMSESDGHSAKIPPNSWLVYDFELVKVH